MVVASTWSRLAHPVELDLRGEQRLGGLRHAGHVGLADLERGSRPRGPGGRRCARSPRASATGTPVLADAGEQVGVDPVHQLVGPAPCVVPLGGPLGQRAAAADLLQRVPLLLAALGLEEPGAAGLVPRPEALGERLVVRPGDADLDGGGPQRPRRRFAPVAGLVDHGLGGLGAGQRGLRGGRGPRWRPARCCAACRQDDR